ncbi:hypothetical protein COO60DRAFT_1554313, partial [Scenedesmus sp. NREL 46B-D3]
MGRLGCAWGRFQLQCAGLEWGQPASAAAVCAGRAAAVGHDRRGAVPVPVVCSAPAGAAVGAVEPGGQPHTASAGAAAGARRPVPAAVVGGRPAGQRGVAEAPTAPPAAHAQPAADGSRAIHGAGLVVVRVELLAGVWRQQEARAGPAAAAAVVGGHVLRCSVRCPAQLHRQTAQRDAAGVCAAG